MTAAVTYIAVMVFTGYVAYRLFDGLRAGAVDRHFWLGPRWHVRLRREPLTFGLMMCLWFGALLFVGALMVGMSYGYWTGQWSQR